MQLWSEVYIHGRESHSYFELLMIPLNCADVIKDVQHTQMYKLEFTSNFGSEEYMQAQIYTYSPTHILLNVP